MKNLIQSIFILIAVLLSTTGAHEVIYAQVGDTVKLNPPTIDRKNFYVTWSFGEEKTIVWRHYLGGKRIEEALLTMTDILAFAELPEEWKDRLTYSSDPLVISNIQQENFGTFIYKVTGDNKEPLIIKYEVVEINVSLSPASPLLSGEAMTLTCDTDATEIHWVDPQKKKHNGRGLTVTTTYQHNGQWTCVVTSNGKESKAKIPVTVINLSVPSHPQYTTNSSSVTIPCSLLPDISWDNIKTKVERVQWHFSPKSSSSQQYNLNLSLEEMEWEGDQAKNLIPASNLKGGDLSLTKRQATEDDEGNYTCSLVLKKDRILTRTIQVQMLEITSPRTDYISGQQVNLTCSTGYPLPPGIQLKWFPPKSSSRQIFDPQQAHLNIPEVRKEDSGKWRCELWQNTKRLTSAAIILKIESNLSVSMLVTICGATVIVILICILVLILHRRRQRKMRHLRHRVCRCKNPKPKGFYRS